MTNAGQGNYHHFFALAVWNHYAALVFLQDRWKASKNKDSYLIS